MAAVIDTLLSVPHAILPERLLDVLAVADGLGDIELAARQRSVYTERTRLRLEAVAATPLKTISGMRYTYQRGSVGILEINGPIYRYAGMFDDISALSSVQRLSTEFNQLLTMPSIETIVLLVDSPGGQVDGISQFAAMIHAAREQKRIVAYVDGDACSAAYWLAAAAHEIVMADTARAGSIGVRMSMRDPKIAREGMYIMVDSEAPNKDPDPATSEGQAELRRQVEPLAAIFRAAVARYRGMAESTITVLRGGVRIGQEAISAGLADRLASFEALMEELAAAGPHSQKGQLVMTNEQFLATLTQATPEQSNLIMDALKAQASTPIALEALSEKLDALTEASTGQIQANHAAQIAMTGELTALKEAQSSHQSILDALNNRLTALEGEQPPANQPAVGGYRASVNGVAPSEDLRGQQPTAAGVDPGFGSFLVAGKTA